MAGPPVIETHGLTKRYGELVAVDRLDLAIGAGEVFGLLGPNGAGKTTTILMLLGLSEPSGGTARVLGLDPFRDPLGVKRQVGYLPDSVGFYPELTGRENLRYMARLNRLPVDLAEPRIEYLLREVGLDGRGDDRVGDYSRGMRQRLGMADALVKDPDVLILDEPTASIDPAGVEEMLTLIRRLPAELGVTVMVSSHLLEQVQAVCDRIGIFVAGHLAACGSITDLAGEGTVIEVTSEGPGDTGAILRGVAGVSEARQAGPLWLVRADGDRRREISGALVGAGHTVLHLGSRTEHLSDIYHRYFQEQADALDRDPD